MVVVAEPVRERDYSAAERRRLAARGLAMSDGSFPIIDAEDLMNAVGLVGHASDPAAVRRHVIRRARALGMMARLPEAWGVREAAPIAIREAGVGLTEALAGAEGAPPRDFRVVLVREGLAKSGRYYTRRAVEDVAAAASGLRAFANHPTPEEDRQRPVRSVRDLVGVYRDAGVQEAEGKAQAFATFHVFEHAAWLASLARESLDVGGEVVGLSLDGLAVVKAGEPAGVGRRVPVVESMTELKSVDVVTRPSAGGGFLSVQEAAMVAAEVIEQVQEGASGAAASVSRENSPQDVPEAVREALAQSERVLGEVREAHLRHEQQAVLEERLAAASGLPSRVRELLRIDCAPDPGRFVTREAYAEWVDARVGAQSELLQALVAERPAPERQIVTGYGTVRIAVAEADKQRLVVQCAMDRLMGFETAEDADRQEAERLGLLASVPRWMGLREAYTQLTGDAFVTGTVQPELSIVREANEVTTTVLNQVVLNSLTKRLVHDYRGQPQDWKRFCSVRSIKDFKTQDRVALSDFGSLSTVAENAAYTNLAWDDRKEVYTPAKKGNLVVVTREVILGDDLDAVRRIPAKLAVAAGITMNEFVYGMFTGNPVMGDGDKVFDDGVQVTHLNRGTAALSSAALQAAITLMLKQTNTAGKRLNLRPRYLLVPPDLLFTALTIVNSTLIPGSANNDVNVLQGAVVPISVAQFADVTDWYLIAAPQDVESIELGFVGGREEPELLLQGRPDTGQVFTNDAISYKIRWEFGGGWLNYRGAFVANVAG